MTERAVSPKLKRRHIEMALFWGGVLLTAAGAALFALPAAPAPVVLGAGLAALGLSLLLAGDIVAGPAPRSYSARGQVVRGRVDIAAGLSNVVIRGGLTDRAAAVTFGPFGRPQVTVEEGVAHVRLASPRLLPSLATWRAELAGNVLWDLDVRSSLGGLLLDLRSLRLERVSAQTWMGRLRVICPETRGHTEIELKTALGAIEVIIPEGVGAQVTVSHGSLGTVRQKNERLLAPGQRRYVTADFESAAAQVDIRIEAASGDIVLA